MNAPPATTMHRLRSVARLAALAAGLMAGGCVGGVEAPVPTLHVSDLFRPHDDPDDHWDLATQYALAFQGRVDLRGVMIDFPKAARAVGRSPSGRGWRHRSGGCERVCGLDARSAYAGDHSRLGLMS